MRTNGQAKNLLVWGMDLEFRSISLGARKMGKLLQLNQSQTQKSSMIKRMPDPQN